MGLVVLCCPAGGVVSAETRFWHPDGSLVRLSGDGLLCVSHAAAIASGVEDLVIKARTDAGPKRCTATAAEAGDVMVEATLGVAEAGPLPDLDALSPPAAAGCGCCAGTPSMSAVRISCAKSSTSKRPMLMLSAKRWRRCSLAVSAFISWRREPATRSSCGPGRAERGVSLRAVPGRWLPSPRCVNGDEPQPM